MNAAVTQDKPAPTRKLRTIVFTMEQWEKRISRFMPPREQPTPKRRKAEVQP
jgi:hypothetical protein